MKKLFKWLFILVVAAAVLLGGAMAALYFMFPPAKLKAMGQEYVKTNFNRDIDFDSLGFNLIGVSLKGFRFSEAGGFKNGVFVAAGKAVVKVQVKPLLSRKVEISTIGLEDLDIKVIKNKNGKFNFDDIMQNAAKLSGGNAAAPQSPAHAAAAPAAVAVIADNVYLKNANVSYADKAAGMDFAVRAANFSVAHFDFDNPFNFEGSFATDIKLPEIKLSPVLFAFAGRADLAGMDMKKASVELINFEGSYKTFKASLNGKVSNFDNPAAVLNGAVTGIDNKLAQEFAPAQLPSFALPKINLALNTLTSLEKNTTKINEAKISLGNSYVRASADIDYGSPALKYKSDTKISVSLKEAADIAKESLAAFALAGSIDGDIHAASSASALPAVKGNITFKDIGALAAGRQLKNLNGAVVINSLNDIKTNVIKGVFDGSGFTTSLAYAKPAKKSIINFSFDMDKFTLDDIDFAALMPAPAKTDGAKTASAAKSTAQQQPQQQEPLVCQTCPRGDAADIKANIAVHKIANNIFDTNDFNLNIDIKDLDNRLDKAAGTVNFSTKNGEIKDLEKLMAASKYLKIALTSLHVVQQAFGALKLDTASFNADRIAYTLIEGSYTLKGGGLTINKTDLNSDLATIKTTGSLGLLSEKLDMKVQAHLGKQGSSGFKPVVIKIGGTAAKPSYKLDVASTLTSVLGAGQGASAAQNSQAIKDNAAQAIKNIGNLFKKK
ncbi:MAG: AsmA family protein [Elusimicrobiota bacterium]|jgi:AsmA protein|nr:AsmA family protein [Elusimicrobiota bacterium]